MTVHSDATPDHTGAVVHKLIEVCEDGVRGFETAAELLDGQHRASFLALGQERQQLSAELHQCAERFGIAQPDSGTAKAAAHRAWLRLRDMAPGDNTHGVISAAEEGEDYALEQYDEALDDEISEEVRRVVVRQRAKVKESHDRVRAMQEATG